MPLILHIENDVHESQLSARPIPNRHADTEDNNAFANRREVEAKVICKRLQCRRFRCSRARCDAVAKEDSKSCRLVVTDKRCLLARGFPEFHRNWHARLGIAGVRQSRILGLEEKDADFGETCAVQLAAVDSVD